MILGITGHRPHKIGAEETPLRNWVRAEIYGALLHLRPTKAISGMAVGIDQDFAVMCTRLDIPFVAAVPFEGQERRWPPSAQVHYRGLLSRATDVVYVSDPGYAHWKMDVRNAWIVDHCTHLLAVFDGTPGGTANTFNYATRVGREISRIDPSQAVTRAVRE